MVGFVRGWFVAKATFVGGRKKAASCFYFFVSPRPLLPPANAVNFFVGL